MIKINHVGKPTRQNPPPRKAKLLCYVDELVLSKTKRTLPLCGYLLFYPTDPSQTTTGVLKIGCGFILQVSPKALNRRSPLQRVPGVFPGPISPKSCWMNETTTTHSVQMWAFKRTYCQLLGLLCADGVCGCVCVCAFGAKFLLPNLVQTRGNSNGTSC